MRVCAFRLDLSLKPEVHGFSELGLRETEVATLLRELQAWQNYADSGPAEQVALSGPAKFGGLDRSPPVPLSVRHALEDPALGQASGSQKAGEVTPCRQNKLGFHCGKRDRLEVFAWAGHMHHWRPSSPRLPESTTLESGGGGRHKHCWSHFCSRA